MITVLAFLAGTIVGALLARRRLCAQLADACERDVVTRVGRQEYLLTPCGYWIGKGRNKVRIS